MKFLVPLVIAHVIQCVASKSWNSDSYQEEPFFVFSWFSYLKRLFLISLMLSGVVLYYVPESRPHARRICHALIDLTACGLKSVLSTNEDEQVYEKIKSNCQRAQYEQSLAAQKRVSRGDQDDEDFGNEPKDQGKKAKMFVDGDGLPILDRIREKRKISTKLCRERRLSRQRLRSSIVKDPSGDPTEISRSIYLYPDRLEDIQRYLKSNLYSVKRSSATPLENYALLISGSPQQMAMFDGKYEKDDVVIMPDPCVRVEYKECSTSMDKLSSIAEVSGSEQEGPTRDYNDQSMESGPETYVKDAELNSMLEGDSRYSVNKSFYQTSQYQCGGECCGNGCSVSSTELNNNREALVPPDDTKNVLKLSRSMVTSKLYKKMEEKNENYTKYNHEGGRFMKSNSLNNRKVDFRTEDKIDVSHQKGEENKYRFVRRGKSRTDNFPKTFYDNDVSYFTDRSGEADDETSPREEQTNTKHDLDEKPQRENYFYVKNSDDSILDHMYDDFDTEPILKNRVKPALLRAVNWIFGGCPQASKSGKVGKEENHKVTGEWLQ